MVHRVNGDDKGVNSLTGFPSRSLIVYRKVGDPVGQKPQSAVFS